MEERKMPSMEEMLEQRKDYDERGFMIDGKFKWFWKWFVEQKYFSPNEKPKDNSSIEGITTFTDGLPVRVIEMTYRNGKFYDRKGNQSEISYWKYVEGQ